MFLIGSLRVLGSFNASSFAQVGTLKYLSIYIFISPRKGEKKREREKEREREAKTVREREIKIWFLIYSDTTNRNK